MTGHTVWKTFEPANCAGRARVPLHFVRLFLCSSMRTSRGRLCSFCVLCSQLLIARKIDLFRSFLLSTVYFDQFNYRFLLFYLDTASCPGMYTWTNYKEFVRLRKRKKVSLYLTALFILRIPLIL